MDDWRKQKEYAQARWAENKQKESALVETLSEAQHDVLAALCNARHKMHVKGADAVWNGYDDWVERLVGGIIQGAGEINMRLRSVGFPEIDLLTFDDCTDRVSLMELSEYYIEDGESYDDARDRLFNEINDIVQDNDRKICKYLEDIDKEHGTEYAPTHRSRGFSLEERKEIRQEEEIYKTSLFQSASEMSIAEMIETDIVVKFPETVAWMINNENLSVSDLEILSGVKELHICRAVAGNANTPVTVLEDLSRDGRPAVRYAVANNENTPATALEVLSKDKNFAVRRAVAENENTPVNVLEDLSTDSDEDVCEAANERLKSQRYISADDLKEAKTEKDERDASAPKQEQQQKRSKEEVKGL